MAAITELPSGKVNQLEYIDREVLFPGICPGRIEGNLIGRHSLLRVIDAYVLRRPEMTDPELQEFSHHLIESLRNWSLSNEHISAETLEGFLEANLKLKEIKNPLAPEPTDIISPRGVADDVNKHVSIYLSSTMRLFARFIREHGGQETAMYQEIDATDYFEELRNGIANTYVTEDQILARYQARRDELKKNGRLSVLNIKEEGDLYDSKN